MPIFPGISWFGQTNDHKNQSYSQMSARQYHYRWRRRHTLPLIYVDNYWQWHCLYFFRF